MSEAVCIIPARGGSRGIRRKNLQPLLGEPLVARTVRMAWRGSSITRVVVTTDAGEVAAQVRAAEADVGGRLRFLATNGACGRLFLHSPTSSP